MLGNLLVRAMMLGMLQGLIAGRISRICSYAQYTVGVGCCARPYVTSYVLRIVYRCTTFCSLAGCCESAVAACRLVRAH